MKRMLFVTAYPPSNQGGGELVTLDAIKRLSKDFEIDLVYFDYPSHKNLAEPYVKSVQVYYPSKKGCISKIKYFPLFTRRFDKKLLSKIQSVVSNYDILFFDFSQTAIYSLYIKHPYKVIRCHDVIFQKYGRKCKLIIPWVKYTEKKILQSAQKVFTLTKKDSELLKNEYRIDAKFSSDVLDIGDYVIPDIIELNNKFIFFGYWKRKENSDGLIWFLDKVYPLLNENRKNCLVVMGGGLSESIINLYLQKLGVKYLGYVDDCYPEIVKYSAMICPLFQGAGIKIKVLDSYITGTPVIGTDIAFEGIPYIKDLEYRCNTPEAFATTINNFTSYNIMEKKELKKSFNSIKTGNTLINQL